ncbi:hypothetical protein BCU85_16605 [Vibrio lentus]|uniref:hypothetical protein n=1 Tax=Vibrio lentus TaxID=136468 RepID=UPI000C82D5CD|nr:hypothetical protein [Vibrio lentus]MCC4817043.1 hypothetical protein [Vibrio lentus]PMG73411.1 hypothetical protein BCU85_16605 [Vibrio lentus]PML21937.1 hypothetical protein BCT80_08095 [Vibrio lentus]PMM29236.1 hypothetical protein BCT57_00355 [Vibrio lentus]
MNPSSAHGYIEIVKHMMSGRQYTRTINPQATEYYLVTKTSKQPVVRKILEKYTLVAEQHLEQAVKLASLDSSKHSNNGRERHYE